MSIKSKLMTSAAALTLISGAAIADQHTAANTENSAEYAAGWSESLDQQFNDIADTQMAELIGMAVTSDQGDDVGEVDNFVLVDDQLKAVVGVGGFLGLGEHHVAISLSDMEYNGEALVVSFTREELEAMPEYTEEMEAQRLAETDTFRERQGDMENATDANTEMAATQLEEDPSEATEGEAVAEVDPGTDEDASPTGEEVAAAEEAAEQSGMDGDTQLEETAEAEQGEIEQEAEELMAEAEATAEEAGAEMADAAEATENAVEGAAAEAGQEVAEAEEAVEGAAAEAGAEMADAAEATENAVEGAAAEAGQEVAEAEEAVEGAAAEAGAEVAEAAEATENAVEGAAAEAGQEVAEAEEAVEGAAAEAGQEMAEAGEAVEGAAEEAGDWMANFADIADWQINEIEGKDIASTDGNVIGEVEDLARQDGKLVALVGIGGFLGLGEHDVALDMSNLTWDGEKFIAEGYTEDDLKAMAEYDAETVEMLDDDITLNEVNM